MNKAQFAVNIRWICISSLEVAAELFTLIGLWSHKFRALIQ